MYKIDIKFGFQCNNKCRFCVQGNKRDLYKPFSTDEIMKKLQDGIKIGDRVVFTGGEVTIREDFLLLVKTAKNIGYKLIQIQTNGRMFCDKTFSEKTIEAGANDFSLALHGHIPELHDYLTRVKGSFFQTVIGIRNLKGMSQYVGTNTVINRSNYRNLPDIAKLLIYLKVDQFQFAFVHALGSAEENFKSIVPRFALVEKYVKNALELGIRAKKVVMTEAIPYCFMSDFTDYIAEKIIPDTKIYDVNIIDNYTEYRKTEGKSKSDRCKECHYFNDCEGPWKEYPENYGWDEFIPVGEIRT